MIVRYWETSLSVILVLLMRVSTLVTSCCVQRVLWGNVIQSSFHGWLPTSKTSTPTQSSSLNAQHVKLQNYGLKKWRSSSGKSVTISYTSKGRYSSLGEMRQRDWKQDNTWKIEWLESENACSATWNEFRQQLLSFPIFINLLISVCFNSWLAGYGPSWKNIPGLTNSTSSGW